VEWVDYEKKEPKSQTHQAENLAPNRERNSQKTVKVHSNEDKLGSERDPHSEKKVHCMWSLGRRLAGARAGRRFFEYLLVGVSTARLAILVEVRH